MRCPKCGKENQPGAKFCIICGSTLPNDDQDTVFLNQQNVFIPPVLNNQSSAQPLGFNYQPGDINVNKDAPYTLNHQPSVQPQVKPKSKLSKGAIAAIIVAAVVVVASISGIIGAVIQHQKAIDAVEDIEIPDIPDFDFDSDFDTDSDLAGDSGTDVPQFGYINDQNVYVNEMYDLKFKLPDPDWSFYDKEQIYQFSQSLDIDTYFDESTEETYVLDNFGTTYYDLFMQNIVNGSNMQCMLYDTVNQDITPGDVAYSIESEVKLNDPSAEFEDTGIITYGENIYTVRTAKSTVNDTDITQYYAISAVHGDIVCIAATFLSSEAPSAIEFFSSIDAH